MTISERDWTARTLAPRYSTDDVARNIVQQSPNGIEVSVRQFSMFDTGIQSLDYIGFCPRDFNVRHTPRQYWCQRQ